MRKWMMSLLACTALIGSSSMTLAAGGTAVVSQTVTMKKESLQDVLSSLKKLQRTSLYIEYKTSQKMNPKVLAEGSTTSSATVTTTQLWRNEKENKLMEIQRTPETVYTNPKGETRTSSAWVNYGLIDGQNLYSYSKTDQRHNAYHSVKKEKELPREVEDLELTIKNPIAKLNYVGRETLQGRAAYHFLIVAPGIKVDKWVDIQTGILLKVVDTHESGVGTKEFTQLNLKPVFTDQTFKISLPKGVVYRKM